MAKYEYVVPLMTDVKKGVGVIIGDWLVTAGHLWKDCSSYSIPWKGLNVIVEKSAAVYLNEGDAEGEQPDVAIFWAMGLNSPLTLSKSVPENGTILGTVLKRKLGASHEAEIENMYGRCEVISSLTPWYWKGHSDTELLKEDHGSPLVIKNEVFGLLIDSEPGTARCRCLTAAQLGKLIESLPM